MSSATVTTSPTKGVTDPQKTIDAIKKGSAENTTSEQNTAGNGEETAAVLNGSTIKINIDEYMGDDGEQNASKFDLDDDSFADIKLEDYSHNLNLVIKGLDKEFVKNKDKVKEELKKLFTDTIKVGLPSVYSPEGKNNYVYVRAKTLEDKKKIMTALAEPTQFLTYKIQAKPCLINNFAYIVVDDSNKDEALDLILKHRNISYRDQLLHKSNEARQLLKATLDKFEDEIKTRVEKLERKYQPPHANVEKIVPLVPTEHYLRECDVRIEINPVNNEIVSGILVTDKKLSTTYLLPLKYCIHIAKPLIETAEHFVAYLKTTTQLKAYNRATGEGDVIGLKVLMNRACEVMMTVELVRKSELAYGFVPLDPSEAATASEIALFGKKAILGKRVRMRKNKPGTPSGGAKTSTPTKTDSTAAATTTTTPASGGETSETKPAEQDSTATTEKPADGDEKKDPAKDDASNLNQLIHLKACDDDSFDFKVSQVERILLSAQVNNIKNDLVQYYNQYKLRHGIVVVLISWVKVLGSHHFESAPFTHQIFKRGMLKDDYNGHTYDFNTVKSFVPRTVTFESLMRAVEDVVNFAKHPPENLALCSDYRFLMLYFAKKCKQLMVFHRWKCAEGTFRPQWWVKSGVRMSNSAAICFAQNNNGQMKEANKLFTAKGIPGTLITWGDMNLGIFSRLVELGCKQVVMVFPESSVFGSLGKYIKIAYPYLRLTRVITVDCQPGGELFSFVAVFQQATGAPPLKKIPGVTPGMAVGPSPVKGKRPPPPSGPPRPLVMDQGPPNKFPRRDFGPMGRPPMEGPPRGGNFGRDRYIDDRPPYHGPPPRMERDPWMDNRGPPSYPSDRFDRGGPPPSSYGPPPPEIMEPRSMREGGGGGGGGGRPSSAGGPPAPDPNITSALNTLSVFMQSQLEFNKMLRTNIEKMSTAPSPSPAVAPPSLAASSTQASFPEPVAPPAPSLSRPRRESPPPLMPAKRAWAKDEPEREPKRPYYGGGGSGGGRSFYDDGPSNGPADSFGARRSGGAGSRPSTSDRVVRETRDAWDDDVPPSKGWDNPPSGGGGSGGGGGRYGVEPSSSVWGSRDEPTAAYTRDVRVKDEEPARPPRSGGGGGGGFASDPRSSFGSLAAQRPAYTTPTSNWGGSAARDRDSRPSGLGRNVGGGSAGGGDRFGSSSDRFGSSGGDRFGASGGDRFGSSGGDRFGGGSNDRFGSSSDRFGGGGANRSVGSDRFGGSGGSISVDRYGGGGGGGSGGFGGGNNDDNRFGGGRSSWSSGGGGSSGGRGFGNNSGEPRSSWGGSGGYNNSSSSFYK